jgi:Family of unknown function (DUF6232)
MSSQELQVFLGPMPSSRLKRRGFVSGTESASNMGDAQDTPSTRLMSENEMSTRPIETAFYSDDRGIRVTNSLLVFGDTTYSIANLTSVTIERAATNFSLVVLLLLLLLVCILGLVADDTSLSVMGGAGTLIFAVAIVISLALKKWKLTIANSYGEVSPIDSRQKACIEKIARSIQEALIQRR